MGIAKNIEELKAFFVYNEKKLYDWVRIVYYYKDSSDTLPYNNCFHKTTFLSDIKEVVDFFKKNI